MTDDLLDEATRLHYEVIRDDRDAERRRLTAEHDLVPALIERVQQAEFQSSFRATEWAGAEKARERAEAERVAYNRAMDEQATVITEMSRRIDNLSAELARLDGRRKREVYSASERGRIYAKEIARVKAERDAARGKLDKVREAVQSGAIVAESDLLLAILDGKAG